MQPHQFNAEHVSITILFRVVNEQEGHPVLHMIEQNNNNFVFQSD